MLGIIYLVMLGVKVLKIVLLYNIIGIDILYEIQYYMSNKVTYGK